MLIVTGIVFLSLKQRAPIWAKGEPDNVSREIEAKKRGPYRHRPEAWRHAEIGKSD